MHTYFEFQTPPRLLSGAFALENIAHELTLLGASKPLLISDQGLSAPQRPLPAAP